MLRELPKSNSAKCKAATNLELKLWEVARTSLFAIVHDSAHFMSEPQI